MDFESFVASIVQEKFMQFDEEAADAREQQGIAQKGLGTRPMSDRPGMTKEVVDEKEDKPVSTATRVLSGMVDYYEPDEFPTQDVRIDSAPKFSSINRSTVLDILSANRDGLEKQGIVKMPMGMLRQPDPTLDIDGLQSRILDKLDYKTPEGSPQDIQYGADLGKLGKVEDRDDEDISVDRTAPTSILDDRGLGSRFKSLEPVGEGDPILKAGNLDITENNQFTVNALTTAVNSISDNSWFSALVLGTNGFETGGEGLVDEELFYKPPNARATFGTDDANRVLATLPTDVQARLNNGSDTQEDRNTYGIALADDQYDGGSNYAGRGLVQLTGRDNYSAVQDHLAEKGIDVDLVGNPDLVNDPRYALQVVLAFFERNEAGAGNKVNRQNAKEMGPYKLSRLINVGEGETDVNRRWSTFSSYLQGADLGDANFSNEKDAQRTAGITGTYADGRSKIDGNIGPASIAAFKRYLRSENVTIPKGATPYDLVRLVNGAPE